MQGSQRNRRSSGMPVFQDPFGGFGLGGGRSLFSEFFDRDPFDDPFFTQPFGSIFGSSGSLFGQNRFFDRGSMFGDEGSFGHPARGFIDQMPFSPQQEIHSQPVIEELPDDHATANMTSGSSGEPIVEHPDDNVTTGRASGRQIFRQQTHTAGQPNNFTQSYSFSSVTYGGPRGAYYTSSTSRRAGPDGVVEEQHEEHDSRKGEEVRRLARGLGNRGHSVTHHRNSDGKDNFVETLHNLTEEEKNDFDQSWKKQAEKSLPGWSRTRMLGNGNNGFGRRAHAALPSNRTNFTPGGSQQGGTYV
eukprot:c22835_g1_i1 orf=283-1188(+)